MARSCLLGMALVGLVGSCGSTTMGGTGGASGGGGSPSSDPDLADHQALESCVGAETCREAVAQRIEDDEPFTLNDVDCVLTALRDRRPGRYRIELDWTWAQGSETRAYQLVITPTEAIEVGVTQNTELETEMSTDYLPTQRCQLKATSFFDDCIVAVEGWQGDGEAEAFACVFPAIGDGPPWFEDCVEQSPTCE